MELGKGCNIQRKNISEIKDEYLGYKKKLKYSIFYSIIFYSKIIKSQIYVENIVFLFCFVFFLSMNHITSLYKVGSAYHTTDSTAIYMLKK